MLDARNPYAIYQRNRMFKNGSYCGVVVVHFGSLEADGKSAIRSYSFGKLVMGRSLGLVWTGL